MSFRARVLVMVMLVAAVATSATAWLTYRLAAAQMVATRATDRQDADRITRALVDYAQQHATWDGSAEAIKRLPESAGKDINVTTEAGTPVSAGWRAPRAAGSATVNRVDPRPRLVFTDDDADTPTAVAYLEIDAFRYGVRLASCLDLTGLQVILARGRNGVPHVTGPPEALYGTGGVASRCRTLSASSGVERDRDFAAVNGCAGNPDTAARTACLKDAFATQIQQLGPVPVVVTIGPVNGSPGLPVAPLLGVVTLVMVCAAVGSAVVSRRALRPVNALTRAARRLGRGLPWEPIEVRGDDEVAELTRTFNAMVTALKRGEERQRRMVADVAHELRTPLSTVRSYLEGLIDGVVPPGPELFVSLHDEALLQQRIVDDLQDLAQAEAGTLTYRMDLLNVPDLLETCRSAVAVKAEYAGVEIIVRSAGRPEVHADADRIRQVIGNLIGNALRYTPSAGSITLSCDVSRDMVVIEVTDTGCGISAEDLPHVFDRFWRADESRGRTTGGSGLGLAIASQIVTDHGGDMSVRSELGHGTTFTVRLPAVTTASNFEGPMKLSETS